MPCVPKDIKSVGLSQNSNDISGNLDSFERSCNHGDSVFCKEIGLEADLQDMNLYRKKISSNPEMLNSSYIDISKLIEYMPLFFSRQTEYGLESKEKYTFYNHQMGLQRGHSIIEFANKISGNKNIEEKFIQLFCSSVFWLDICYPSLDEIRSIADIFHLHELTLEYLEQDYSEEKQDLRNSAILGQHFSDSAKIEDFNSNRNHVDLRERCDMFTSYLCIYVRAFNQHAEMQNNETEGVFRLQSVDINMLVFPGFVLTLHKEHMQCAEMISTRIRLLSARLGLTADWIVYALLEDIVDQLNPVMHLLEHAVESIDDLVLVLSVNDQADLLHRIAKVRKDIATLKRLFVAKSELLRAIVKRCSIQSSGWLRKDAMIYLRDLHEHLQLVSQNLVYHGEVLARSHSNYLAQINIEVSHASNRMSKVMKRLTIAASIALPWSLVCGIFGMNIYVPGYTSYAEKSWLPFMALLSFMTLLSVGVYVHGRRKWFKDP